MDRPNLLGAQKRGAQTDKSHKIIHLKLINPHRTQGQTTETCRVKQMDNSSSSFRSAAANNSSNSRTRPNVRRCDLCNCTVHGGPASWKTHTEGIQHRRNQASCRLMGEPGHVVVSTFEPLDDHLQAAAAAAAAAAGGGGSRRRNAPQQQQQQQASAVTAAGGGGRAQAGRLRVVAVGGKGKSGTTRPLMTFTECETTTTPTLQQQLKQVQQQVQKHLAAQVGICQTYRDAVEHFDMPKLRGAYRIVQEMVAAGEGEWRISQAMKAGGFLDVVWGPREGAGGNGSNNNRQPLQQQQQQQQHQEGAPVAAAAVAAAAAAQPPQQQQAAVAAAAEQQPQNKQQQQPQQQQPFPHHYQLWADKPAQIAVLTLLLPVMRQLKLTVPYQTFGHAAAATSAATATLLASLSQPQQQQLTHLDLLFECPDYSRLMGQNPGCFMRADSQLWGPVMRTLREAVEFNCGLQQLTLATFPTQLQPDDLQQLQTALASGRRRIVTTLLLGLVEQGGGTAEQQQQQHQHQQPRRRRGGAQHISTSCSSSSSRSSSSSSSSSSRCPLSLLPREVFAEVLHRAVPRQPCVLRLELPPQMREQADQEDDSDSDSDDSDDSDDDSSSDSDSSGSSSSGSGEADDYAIRVDSSLGSSSEDIGSSDSDEEEEEEDD